MTEERIVRILKREVKQITKTGKPPAPGALPDWLLYSEHDLKYSGVAHLAASAKIKNRWRMFYVTITPGVPPTYDIYIDSVRYEEN